MHTACKVALRAERRCTRHHRFSPDQRTGFLSSSQGVPPWQGCTKLSRSPRTQRGHAVCTASSAALRAEWLHSRHHRYALVRRSGLSSSANGGKPPLPFCTKLSRHHARQRGHACPPVASLGGKHASPLWHVRRAGFLVSGHGGRPPWPSNRSVIQRRRRAASHGVAPPLRPHASLLHNAALPSMPGSRCAKAPLGAGHRCAPFG